MCREASDHARVVLPVDSWSPIVDSNSIAFQLFAISLFLYLDSCISVVQANADDDSDLRCWRACLNVEELGFYMA